MHTAIRTLCLTLAFGLSTRAIAQEPAPAVPPPGAAQDAATGAGPDVAAIADYVNAVSNRFAVGIEKHHLPYMTPEVLAALQTEMHDYLSPRVKTPPTGERREAVLEAIDDTVKLRFGGPDSYLSFRTLFDSLRWQLWTATERPPLTADQQAERDRQREWMFDQIRSAPNAENGSGTPEERQAKSLLTLVHNVFGNPLIPFFHDPMSAEEFEAFKKQVEAQSRQPANPAWRIFQVAMIVRRESVLARWPLEFGTSTLPYFGSGGTTGEFFYYSFGDANMNNRSWVVFPAQNTRRDYFDIALRSLGPAACAARCGGNRALVGRAKKGEPVVRCRDAAAAAGAWDQNGTAGKDRVVHRRPGAAGRIRRLLEEAPVESMEVPKFADPGSPVKARIRLDRFPAWCCRTTRGRLPWRGSKPTGDPAAFVLRLGYRPQAAYPPFRPADAEHEEDGLDLYTASPVKAAQPPAGGEPNTAAADADLMDVLADRFAADLQQQKLPYLTAEHLAAIRTEMLHYLKLRVKKSQVGVAGPNCSRRSTSSSASSLSVRIRISISAHISTCSVGSCGPCSIDRN